MTVTFTEKSQIETGFSEVFQDRIAPRLSDLEAERKTYLAKARRHAGIALAVGAAFGVLFTLFGSGSDGVGALVAGFGVPLAFGGVAAFVLWNRQTGKWTGSAAQTVMPVVCDFVGDMSHDHEAHKGFALERMQKLGVVGSYTRAEISDRLEGRYRETDFELVEARLISQKSSSTSSDDDSGDRSSRTVFKGLLMRVAVPEPIPTRILIARDFGIGNKLGELLGGSSGRGMPKVDTGHPEFEQHFEVYAADPDVARDVLAPGFLDNLLAIAEAEGGRHGAQGMQAGFHDDSFFMALRREGDFLKMGSLSTPMDEIEDDLHRIFDDIATIHRIIDRLHGD
ncbi:MAG: DUF3137 domain-containing protein [Sediminimonas sp.]|uniref:DUF3137 domain-containing protein n=1 Tax=Sediminimonas sp. TaxID=2823379 RepID=UPI00286FF122|nr:DUF3137 domain-containing protein [Sediminimonas sp.]MDR9485540.1 DUF3137 domain-containing protein [Sediminimonas sp.]